MLPLHRCGRRSSAGDFDPTAGLSGNLGASVAIQGLVQKGKSYGTRDDSLMVTLAGQGETGFLYSVRGALPH